MMYTNVEHLYYTCTHAVCQSLHYTIEPRQTLYPLSGIIYPMDLHTNHTVPSAPSPPTTDADPRDRFMRFARAIFAVPKAEYEAVVAASDRPKQNGGRKPKAKQPTA